MDCEKYTSKSFYRIVYLLSTLNSILHNKVNPAETSPHQKLKVIDFKCKDHP